MSFFENLLSQTKKVLTFSSSVSSVVGIDIGTSSLKIVQVTKEKNVIKLETYGELALGPYAQDLVGKIAVLDPETITRAIKDILKEAKVTTQVALFSIQSQATLIFLMELPQEAESQLASIIPNEARKYIPVPLTEVSLDWYIVPQKQTYEDEHQGVARKMEVVVVAVRNETLSLYRDIQQQVGCETRGQEIEIFSTIRSVFHQEIAPVCIIDFGASTTKVAVVEYGAVRMYHVINRGAVFLTESIARTLSVTFDVAENLKRQEDISHHEHATEIQTMIQSHLQNLVNEVQTILLPYERQSHQTITKIILCGGGAHLHGCQEAFAQAFGVDTTLARPFDKVVTPEFMQQVLLEAGPEFSVAVGLALKEFI